MSIRDIIVRLAEDMDGCDKDDGRGCALHCDMTLVSAEVALMEAVCEAAEAVAADYEKQPDDCDAVELTAMYQRLASATSALQAYRKEATDE